MGFGFKGRKGGCLTRRKCARRASGTFWRAGLDPVSAWWGTACGRRSTRRAARTTVNNHLVLSSDQRDVALVLGIEYPLRRVTRFLSNRGASGLFRRQSEKRTWMISYWPRYSAGKGLKQSWTMKLTLNKRYVGENCSLEISKPSTT